MSRSRRSQWQALVRSQVAASKSGTEPVPVTTANTDRRAAWLASMMAESQVNTSVGKASNALASTELAVTTGPEPEATESEVTESEVAEPEATEIHGSAVPSSEWTKQELVDHLVLQSGDKFSRSSLLRKKKHDLLDLIA